MLSDRSHTRVSGVSVGVTGAWNDRNARDRAGGCRTNIEGRHFKSLTPEKCDGDFKNEIFKLFKQNSSLSTGCGIAATVNATEQH